MTRNETQIIKGLAILLMLFLHLFNYNTTKLEELCTPIIYIGSIPFVEILSRASNPVAFFLIVGGYGLYKVWLKGDRNRWSRLLKLYIHWWGVLIIFTTIGHFIFPEKFPHSWLDFLLNATGLDVSYNNVLWFLLPYAVLSALSPVMFRFYQRFKALPIVFVSLSIYVLTSYCISKYGTSYLYKNFIIYNLVLPFHLLFNFSIGAIAAREEWFEKINYKFNASRSYFFKDALPVLGIILLIFINCVFKFKFFYAFLFICCFSLIKFNGWAEKIMIKLGNQSMNMWMFHVWFCDVLFVKLTYALKYSILIFVGITIISYFCSVLLDSLVKPIEKLMMPRKQINEKPIL